MKQGKPVITFTIFALAVVIVIYFGYYVFNALDEPFRTAQVYAYTAHDSVAAEGLVIREAQVLPAQNGILEVTRAGRQGPADRPGLSGPPGPGRPGRH